MDAEWEFVERSRSINALAMRDVKPAELEVVKREGNACFQRRQFADAVQKYSFVIDCCIEKLSLTAQSRVQQNGGVEGKELSAVAAMEVAVRLNRALVLIEKQEFVAAEDDCAAVLGKQPDCVKALYRRALARESLGKFVEATADLHAMLKLEPANPAALQLLERLQANQVRINHAPTAEEDSALASELRDCSLTNETARSRLELAAVAELAWKVLQEEELQMRQAVQAKKSSTVPMNKSKEKLQQTAVVTPTRKQTSQQQQQQQQHQHAGSSKINDLWESLAQEEQNTVARVYQKRRANTRSK